MYMAECKKLVNTLLQSTWREFRLLKCKQMLCFKTEVVDHHCVGVFYDRTESAGCHWFGMLLVSTSKISRLLLCWSVMGFSQWNKSWNKHNFNSVNLASLVVSTHHMAHDMLHMISTRCVACDLHTTALRQFEHALWRKFVAQWGDCKKISNGVFHCCYYYYYYYHHHHFYSYHWRPE